MKNHSSTTPSPKKKSHAAEKLGGQPESDRDAQEAGVASATSPQESHEGEKRQGDEAESKRKK